MWSLTAEVPSARLATGAGSRALVCCAPKLKRPSGQVSRTGACGGDARTARCRCGFVDPGDQGRARRHRRRRDRRDGPRAARGDRHGRGPRNRSRGLVDGARRGAREHRRGRRRSRRSRSAASSTASSCSTATGGRCGRRCCGTTRAARPMRRALVAERGAAWWAETTGCVPVASFTVVEVGVAAADRAGDRGAGGGRAAAARLPDRAPLRRGRDRPRRRVGTAWLDPVTGRYRERGAGAAGRRARSGAAARRAGARRDRRAASRRPLPTTLGLRAGIPVGCGTGDNMAAGAGARRAVRVSRSSRSARRAPRT